MNGSHGLLVKKRPWELILVVRVAFDEERNRVWRRENLLFRPRSILMITFSFTRSLRKKTFDVHLRSGLAISTIVKVVFIWHFSNWMFRDTFTKDNRLSMQSAMSNDRSQWSFMQRERWKSHFFILESKWTCQYWPFISGKEPTEYWHQYDFRFSPHMLTTSLAGESENGSWRVLTTVCSTVPLTSFCHHFSFEQMNYFGVLLLFIHIDHQQQLSTLDRCRRLSIGTENTWALLKSRLNCDSNSSISPNPSPFFRSVGRMLRIRYQMKKSRRRIMFLLPPCTLITEWSAVR